MTNYCKKFNKTANFHKILKSYLHSKYFYIKQNDATTEIHKIHSGVPQGIFWTRYYIYIADLPTNANVTIATFADNTAVLAIHSDPILASRYLQESLCLIQDWLKRWRVKANGTKSTHAYELIFTRTAM